LSGKYYEVILETLVPFKFEELRILINDKLAHVAVIITEIKEKKETKP
jgi:hypothetical protein